MTDTSTPDSRPPAAGLAATAPPPLPEPAVVVVLAADHGVHAQGVSP